MARLMHLAHGRAEAVADFVTRNAERFRPFGPSRSADYFTRDHWRRAIRQAREEERAGTARRWLVCEGDRVIAKADLDRIARGPLQSAVLGYMLDAEFEGRGVMSRALGVVLGDAFGELGLHRVEAAIMPDNARSLACIRRLGFREIGLARAYLKLDGAWRDHLLFERLAEDGSDAGG